MKNIPQIALLGYGSQGRAWGQNLLDSGADLIIGLPSKATSRRIAKKDGIGKITTVGKAVKNADLIIFAFPDQLHGPLFEKEIKPNMPNGSALVFLHGYSIHFKTVIPSDHNDLILLAPLGPGVSVRELFLKKESIGYFYDISRDATGKAEKRLNALVQHLKIDKNLMIRTSFADEAVGDLFGEQAVLCGGLTQLIMAGYETLVENGLSSDKAYLEVAYQLDLIIDLIKKHGIEGMYKRISLAARYGASVNGPRIIDKSVKWKMSQVYDEIASGKFASQMNRLKKTDLDKLDKSLKKMSSDSFEKAAKKFSSEKNKKK